MSAPPDDRTAGSPPPLTGPDEAALLTAVAAATAERLSAAACSIALLDGDALVFVAASGAGAAQVLGLRLPLGRGIAGWVAVSGQSIAVADVGSDARHDRESAARTGYLPTSILAVPVEADEDGPLGVLSVLDRVPDARDLEVAGAAARQAALVRTLALSRAALDAQLTDPALAGLTALVGELGARSERERRLASRLLRAVLDEDA